MSAVITASPKAVASQTTRILRRFRDSGATTPDHAIDPAIHKIHQTFVFNKLVREGVLVKARSHRYYLDEVRAAQYREQRYQNLLVFMVVLIIALVVYLFMRWL
ncbi:hypothetical protein [Flavisolibacter tropicus]|uniref:Uncharacterized protein n=1 Tax=Flavisolibacter tropicus TaxID=1492898 RepID=A0A172TX56_9BACT|nr:hypothetical protein [Flavisolibacter tropicus]ANE51317.1 hypothetical protein SY85_13145 [Flavisolibacter tropicus]